MFPHEIGHRANILNVRIILYDGLGVEYISSVSGDLFDYFPAALSDLIGCSEA